MNAKKTTKGGGKNTLLLRRLQNYIIGQAKSQEAVQKVDEIIDSFDYSEMTAPVINYEQFCKKQKVKKAAVRRLILTTAIIGTVLAGLGAAAHNTSWFTRLFQLNRIEYDTSSEIKKIDNNFKTYGSIEALKNDLQFPIPLLTEFPEELTATTINMEDYGDIIKIQISYSDRIILTYQYYKAGNISMNVYEPNPSYYTVGEFNILGNTATVYSDMERRVAYWTYQNITILIETKYEVNKLLEMLQKIKI